MQMRSMRWWMLAGLLAGCGPGVTVTGSGGSDGGEDDSTGADETGMSADLPPQAPDPFEGARLVELEVPLGYHVFGDFDGDGADDLLSSYEFVFGETGFSQYLFELQRIDLEAPSLESLLQRDVGFLARGLVTGWVDGDDRLDLLNVGTTSITQIAVRADDFEIAPSSDVSGTRLGRPVDYDGDHRSEYVGIYQATIRIFAVDLMGGWSEVQVLDFEADCTPTGAYWHELSGDGRLDMLVVGRCSDRTTLTTYAQAADGSLSIVAEGELGLAVDRVDLADFDDDGRLDVALGTSRYEAGLPDPETTVLAGLPDGSFGEELLHLSTTADFGAVAVFPADLDGDGVAEPLVWSYQDVLDPALESEWALVRVDGDELVVHPLPSELSPTHAADLDGDGCEEVIEISGLQLRALVPSCE